MPTLAGLADAPLSADRKIDGRDLSPVFLGQTGESPRTAHYFFNGNRLEAVRSGRWKLALVEQTEGMGLGAPKKSKNLQPVLYDLEVDLGETNNVAAQHPEIVARLEKFVAEMDADLGVISRGSGVRAPGRVAQPSGMYLPGHEPAGKLNEKQQ